MIYSYSYYNSTKNYKFIKTYRPDFKIKGFFESSIAQILERHQVHPTLCTSISIFKHKLNESTKVIIQQKYIQNACYLYFSDATCTKLHRVKGPAFVVLNTKSYLPIQSAYYVNGIKHRKNKPQEVSFFLNGVLKKEIYRENDQLHREGDKPAYIGYWYKPINGQKVKQAETYYKNGQLYREKDKPNSILYGIRGEIINENWYSKEGQFHRFTGPAKIFYDRMKCDKTWYVNDKKIDKRKLPVFENNQQINSVRLNKSTVLSAMMFDRDYGNFLKEKLSQIKL